MEKEWLYALLAVFLIIVLLFIPSKIRDVYDVFKGVGEEPGDLTKLRADCTALIDNNEPIDRCALEVAEETLKAKEDSIMVEKWLRLQIEKGEEKYLKESLDFGRTNLYPTSKDWVGAVETYNLIYGRWNSDEVQLAIDEATINVDVDKIFKVYGELRPSGSGEYEFNKNLLNKNYELLKSSLKDAAKIYQKNKDKIADVSLLKPEETCNTKYGSTNLWLPACNYLSRVSLGVGCYLDAAEPANPSNPVEGTCKSCFYYELESLAQDVDVCSGYHNKETCEADPCDKSSCKWMGNSCEAVFGAVNYWDIS